MTSVRRFGDPGYSSLVKDLSGLLESARRAAARTVNAVMTATYWEIGRRIVEFEQGGEKRAEYGAELLETLAADLTRRFGRGFSRQNLQYMRQFYVAFPPDKIRQTASGKSALNIRQTLSSKSETLSRIFTLDALAEAFPLPRSHYILLIGKARSHDARNYGARLWGQVLKHNTARRTSPRSGAPSGAVHARSWPRRVRVNCVASGPERTSE